MVKVAVLDLNDPKNRNRWIVGTPNRARAAFNLKVDKLDLWKDTPSGDAPPELLNAIILSMTFPQFSHIQTTCKLL